MVQITIDGTPVKAPPGRSVLNAALDAGIYIPHICSHPQLSAQGECKLCVVEIGGEPLLSCMTEVREGMAVKTASAELQHLRVTALELMLACHPHDCTSCVVYLNCELQAMMQYLGAAHSRLREVVKRNINLNTGNPLITRELERCIQCGRCVRACRELRDVGILDYRIRDRESYIGTADDLSLAASDCRFCGACIAVCPTGALRDAADVFASKDLPKELALVPCKATCPAHTDVPRYVRLIGQGRYAEASAVVREKAPFPLSLGYVCTRVCEDNCKRGSLNEAVSIRNLKRYASENDADKLWKKGRIIGASTGKKAAVIGSGPCGMTAAYYLARRGHAVTVFERLPVAGGMIATAVPEYRLPRETVAAEVSDILEGGITLVTGRDVKNAPDLMTEGFDAVLVAAGASVGKKLPLPGADRKNVYAALDLLRAAALKREIPLGRTVTVLGGGNVAFDCARVVRRLGVEHVNVICLEPKGGMLADEEEILQGTEEGIVIHNSKSLAAIEGDGDTPTGVRCVDVSRFSFYPDGRLQVETVPGSESVVPADTVVFATGQKTDLSDAFGIGLTKFGYAAVDPVTLATDRVGIFAAGDAVYGTKSVIEAIAAGRRAAEQMDLFLGGNGDISEVLAPVEEPNGRIGKIQGFAEQERYEPACEELACRVSDFGKVDLGFAPDQAADESARCLQCDLRTRIAKGRLWTDYIKQ